ncbi:amino acid ABC transporter permease [Jatrophihabitans sp.]|uniref:amino acid ABC transporter permease n=1 Tax=Jatrophihabitans sp. TaxID=1932789 RepID=UPI0030C669D5|nr:polar amino acid transporter, inner rane subunit [Jatrophihabitans sp.]
MADWQPSALQLERQAYRRSRTRRSALIAFVSTVVVFAAVAIAVVNSPGWSRTRDSFFDLRTGWHDMPALLRALWTNVQIMLICEVIVLVLATLIAVARTLQGPVFFPLRLLAAAYTDIFRGMPLLIVLFLVGYGLPSLRISALPSSPFILCIIALSLTYTAYVAEVLRAGIQSVHPSQRAAARSLGLTHLQTVRHVVFPQAVRRVLPALLNDFVSLQKDTSLVSIVGVLEVVLRAQNFNSQDYKFVHYVFAGLIFVALTVPLTRLTDWIAARQGWNGTGGGVV